MSSLLPPVLSRHPLRWLARGSLHLLVLLTLVTGGACGSGSEPSVPPQTLVPASVPTPAPTAAATKVVVLGDSISAGLGLPADQAFPAIVEAMLQAEGLDIDVQNAGVSGDTSTAGAARVDWLLKQDPQILVVELGGNDLLRGQPVAVTQARLGEIVQAGRAAGAEVILLGISAPGSVGADHKAAFDAIYPAVATEHGATLLPDFLSGLMERPDLLQSDGLHPTADGQKRLAEVLVPVLRATVTRVQAQEQP